MYIGIDGGGTKTKTMLIDEDRNILAVHESDPSSIRTVSRKESISNLVEGIEAVLKNYDGAIKSLFAGIGDVTGESDGQRVIQDLKTALKQLNDVPMVVRNDVYNAHASALNGDEGIVLIIGTGTVAFGVDHLKQTHRAGGYSYKEGDLGSAYGLGSQALSLLARVYDRRMSSSPLTDFLFNYLNIESFSKMVEVFDYYHTQRSEVAKLAPFVTQYAQSSDANAIAIIEVATDELIMMVKAVDQALNFEKKQLGIVGSLGQAKTVFRDMFFEKLKHYDAAYRVLNTKEDPAFGACLLAQKALTPNSL